VSTPTDETGSRNWQAVTDGGSSEVTEAARGYCIIEVKSKEETSPWADLVYSQEEKRCG